MRKLISLVVLAMLAISIAACGGEATPVPPAPTTGAATEATATTAVAEPTATTAAAEATATSATTAADMTPTVGGTGVVTDVSLSAIKQRGKLVVGVKYDVPTFGYLNPATNVVEGFDVELAKAVAQRIFGNADAIEFKEAISRNRIPYLNDGVVDVIFSTMTANAERAQQIDFSDCYYVAGQSLLVPVDSDIKSIGDLGGKTVGTVQGSTSEKNIREKAPDAKVELFGTYSEAVQAMQAGRVQAVTTDDIILYGFAKQNPDRFKVVGGQFTQEPYAAGVKKGNTELVNEVNAALRDLKQSGKWLDLFHQWVSASDNPPVPPQDWQEVYKMPTATVPKP